MKAPKSFLSIALVLVCVLSATLAGVIIDFDRSFDFSSFETYAWVEKDQIPIFQAMPDSNESDVAELDSRIHESIDKQLEKQGFRKVAREEASFLIGYIAVGELDLTVQEYDTSGGSPDIPYGHWRPFYQTNHDTTLMRKGTLTIDVVVAEPRKLVWRGKATDTFDKPKDLDKKLNKIVKDILKKFPPK